MSHHMNGNVAQYEEFLLDIQNNGHSKGDRTGTGTSSLFGCQMRFDLSAGFPLITTKKVHAKSVIAELLWFLSGSTNNNDLEAMGSTIWREWRAPYKLDRKMVLVPKKSAVPSPFYVGDFSSAGFAVGSEDAKLAGVWVKMMRRCYDPSHHRFPQYGGRGATVAQAWHDVRAFVESVKTIPHWYYKSKDWNNFELDKDYWGAFQYGPTTSIWQHTKLNTPASKGILMVAPDGTEMLALGLADAAEKSGIAATTLNRVVSGTHAGIFKGKNTRIADWTFTEVPDSESDLLIRPELTEDGDLGPIYGRQWRSWPVRSTHVNDTGKRVAGSESTIDQISEAIRLLKTDPDSRRIIVSAWNVAELSDMALMPCHAMFQFYTRELNSSERAAEFERRVNGVAGAKALVDKYMDTPMKEVPAFFDVQGIPTRALSCQLYQRSADAFLGVPFNIASYALLTHMMAQQCNMVVGEFIWTGGDCHIYDNHKDQVALQLSREPRPFPQLKLARKPDSIFDYKPSDFIIEGYDPHGPIKAPVAV